MIYLLKHSSVTCSVPDQCFKSSSGASEYPVHPIPFTVQNHPSFTQLSRLLASSWHISACALRPKWYPLSALCPSPCTEPRARCKALAYRQSDGTMLPLTFMTRLAYSNNNNTNSFNGFNAPTATIPNNVPVVNQDDVALMQVQPTARRGSYSFNCKCSIPSSYPASHCP
jgi:hypothetical protein